MSVLVTWEDANKPPANLGVKLSINSEPEKNLVSQPKENIPQQMYSFKGENQANSTSGLNKI